MRLPRPFIPRLRGALLMTAACAVVGGLSTYGILTGRSPSEDDSIVRFDLSTRDFGRVPIGTSLDCQFVFTNVGPEPVRVARIQSSCGCITTDRTARSPIAPGAQGAIQVTVDTEGYSPPLTLSKDVFVEFEYGPLSSETFSRTLTVEALVCPLVQVNPPELLLQIRQDGTSLPARIRIRRDSLSTEVFRTVSLEGGNNELAVREVSRSNTAIEYEISLSRDAYPTSALEVVSNQDERKPCAPPIPISLASSLDAYTKPKQLVLRLSSNPNLHNGISGDRLVEVFGSEVVSVVRVEVRDPEFIELTPATLQEWDRFYVRVKGRPNTEIYRTILNIYYKDRAQTIKGPIVLPVIVHWDS